MSGLSLVSLLVVSCLNILGMIRASCYGLLYVFSPLLFFVPSVIVVVLGCVPCVLTSLLERINTKRIVQVAEGWIKDRAGQKLESVSYSMLHWKTFSECGKHLPKKWKACCEECWVSTEKRVGEKAWVQG